MATLQTLQEFFVDFLEKAKAAQKRIYIQSMIIAEGSTLKQVEDTISPLAAKGVEIRFNIDWVYSRYYHGQIDIVPNFNKADRESFRSSQKANTEMLHRFNQKGFIVEIMNKPGLFELLLPILGRNHIKIYIVDNVAWIGGLNLYDESFQNIDFMVRYEDPRMVQLLTEQFFRINELKLREDMSFPVNEQDKILVDFGGRSKSLILETAISLAEKAQNRIIYLSQMVPEEKLLNILMSKAKVGIPIDIHTSPLSAAAFSSFPKNIPFKTFLRKTAGLPNFSVTHHTNKVHGKLMIFDESDALFGSHNFVDTGVRLGTTEICMWTKDTKLIGDLESFMKTNESA